MKKIIETLNWRYATKAFDPTKKVSSEERDTLIEAFRLTASSFGLQPWKLFVLENQELKEQLVEHTWGQKQIADCSHVLILATPKTFGDSDVDAHLDDIVETRGGTRENLKGYEDMMKGFISKLDESQIQIWMEKQANIALGNLMTVCAEMRIDSCPMEGFIPEKYDEILGLGEKGFSSVLLLPIGYRDESDSYINLKKVRFSTDKISEIIS